MKLNIEPEALVPKLPSPRDLQPFPTTLSIEYKGHTDMVRSISTDKTGQYLLSGSDDCTSNYYNQSLLDENCNFFSKNLGGKHGTLPKNNPNRECGEMCGMVSKCRTVFSFSGDWKRGSVN